MIDAHALLVEAVSWARGHWGSLSGRRAVDLACGAGRDAVFLAAHGFETEAWDLSEAALAEVNARAQAARVRVATTRVDIEAEPALPQAEWDLVSVFNFLHRPLFPAIRDAVKPGGIVAYETFLEAQRSLTGHPRRDEHLLTPGELASFFDGWSIIVNREGFALPERIVASLIAMKPKPS